jgi:hypothetical protein
MLIYIIPKERLTNGASVRLTGVLVPSPGSGQDNELLAESVEVLGECDPEVHTAFTLKFAPLILFLDLSYSKAGSHNRLSPGSRTPAGSHRRSRRSFKIARRRYALFPRILSRQ